MKEGGFMKDAFILFAITLISGLALGAVYQITKDPIDASLLKSQQDAYRQVFEAADTFEENETETAAIEQSSDDILANAGDDVAIDGIVEAKDSSGSVLGHVVTASSSGFGGSVQVSVGIALDGTVNGIAFPSGLSETAGLGMKALQPDFYEQYSGKQVASFEVTKTGASSDNQINAISSATITSKAVTRAVNGALYFANNCISD